MNGVPESDETVVVYNFGTENRRILIDDVTFTDYFEVNEQQKLDAMGDKYFEVWKDQLAESEASNERVLNS